ncbi:hypothetical protein SAMCFNEI73_pB0379 (plasmid) [Sinorhizobium americanum]|uniref:Uncharacterized protein n=1 Tax=Sinorhizobium americanum TaxID=194963 RepID=A0A1L3LU16_9HYPH|nr:hypothetical protein SAMCFNEI73_pB0379 [Sinorhizobium americanum]
MESPRFPAASDALAQQSTNLTQDFCSCEDVGVVAAIP